VLAQLNADQPQASRLLVNAINQHGTMVKPPFKDRQAKPYKTIEDWVYLSTGKTAPPQEQPTATPATDAKPLFPVVAERTDPRPATATVASQPEPATPMAVTGLPSRAAVSPQPEPAAPKAATSAPARPDSGFATTPRQNPDLADPYDPAIFNREVKKAK
jgi:hypothetical protein